MPSVCLVTHSYFPDDPRVRRCASALLEMKFKVDVICLRRDDEAASSKWNGATVTRLPVKRHRGAGVAVYAFEYALFTFCAGLLLTIKMLANRYRVVHINNPPDILIFAAVVPKMLGAKVVFDVHDRVCHLYSSRLGLPQTHVVIRMIDFFEYLAMKIADAVFTVHHPYADLLVKNGARRKSTFIVFNSPDETLFKPAPSVSNDTIRIVHTGTVLKRYGIQVLLDALKILKERGIRTKTTIAGEGDYLPALKEQARTLAIADIVDFIGHVPFDKVPPLLADADVCVVPAILDDSTRFGLNTKFLEAICCKKPLIASRLPVLEHYFSDDCVRYVTPGDAAALADAIAELSADRAQFTARAECAFRRLREAGLYWGSQKLQLQKKYLRF